MKTINVSEATNSQLNWLVAQLEGCLDDDIYPRHSYTTSPESMWPIIERVAKFIDHIGTEKVCVGAHVGNYRWVYGYGPTMLIAAARCYIVSKLGETTEVPEELT